MRPEQPYLGGEQARVLELHRYQVLDTEPERAFERIVDLAQRLFGVPTVLISLVAEDRQWFKARRGFGRCETDLESSFCAHTVRQDEVMVVLDATQDARFQATPLVTGDPFIRFYAGAPLKTPGGYNLGTLCIIDTMPHAEFGRDAQASLADLAALVVESLELRLATRTTQEQAAQTQTILESITEAFYTLDEEWRFTYLNSQAQRLLGRGRAELLGRMVWTVFPESLDSDFSSHCVRAISSGTTATFEYFFAPLNSWFEVHAYPSAEGLSVYFQDIGERKKAEQKLRLQSEFRHNLLSLMQTSLQHGLDRTFYQHILEAAVRLVPGAQAGSLLLKEESRYTYVAAVGFNLGTLQRYTFELENMWLDPKNLEPQLVYDWHTEWLNNDVRPQFDDAGRIGEIKVSLCLPVVVREEVVAYFCLDNFGTADAFDPDATEMARIFAQQTALLLQRLELEAALRREREELEHVACHDALTGLPNRHLFDDRLDQATAQARRSGHTLAVMFFDLDNFKHVNDTYGHTFGDALIRAVATRILPRLREGDTLARWGGDEFVLLLPSLGSAAEAAGVAQRLLELLHRPFELLGKEVRTGASVGVALSQGGAEAAETLVRNADIALYRAKTTRGSYAFFTEQMNRTLRAKIELGEELRAALEAGTLTLHYQPRVDLVSGRVTSLEALARWQHPRKGWVSPSVFIPLAEELGLIRRLGALVLGRACAQAKAWHSAGLGCRVAVNLSVGQLKHPDIVAEVQGALHHCGLEAGLLELEITESTAMTEVEEGIEKLQQLRELGVYLSIDDFGTAYSSLAYLKRLPVHSLKIDRSFVGDLGGGTTKPADTGVVQAILALGKSLGLSVVAEGVETEEQRQTLLRLGCDQAQGYLFAPPLDAAQVERLLQAEAPFVGNL